MHLSDRQQATVAAALTIIAALVIASALLGVLWLLASFVSVFYNVLLPVAVAGIGALVFQPYYDLLHTRLRLPLPLALAALFLTVALPVGAFFGFFGVKIIGEVKDLLAAMPKWWTEATGQMDAHLPQLKKFFCGKPSWSESCAADAGAGSGTGRNR